MNRYSAEIYKVWAHSLANSIEGDVCFPSFFFLRMSCFILEIQLPHLFGVVINLSDLFFLTSFKCVTGAGLIYFSASLRLMVMCSWQRWASERWSGDSWEKRGKENGKRRKEALKDRVKGRKEKTGFLAVSRCSSAKSRPMQDVNKLICQWEVFTHFGFHPALCDSCSLAVWPQMLAGLQHWRVQLALQ